MLTVEPQYSGRFRRVSWLHPSPFSVHPHVVPDSYKNLLTPRNMEKKTILPHPFDIQMLKSIHLLEGKLHEPEPLDPHYRLMCSDLAICPLSLISRSAPLSSWLLLINSHCDLFYLHLLCAEELRRNPRRPKLVGIFLKQSYVMILWLFLRWFNVYFVIVTSRKLSDMITECYIFVIYVFCSIHLKVLKW